MTSGRSLRVGLISDTHGLLRPEVLAFLAGSDCILHAGDICAPEVLDELQKLAPVTAVRGNNDRGAWAESLPHTARLELGGVRIVMVHDRKELAATDLAACDVVISGHSHKPLVEEQGSVLFVNPGSAGPRRFKLPISAGELQVARGRVTARLATF